MPPLQRSVREGRIARSHGGVYPLFCVRRDVDDPWTPQDRSSEQSDGPIPHAARGV